MVVRYDVQFPMAVYSPPRDARSEEVEESGFAFKHWIEWAQRPTTGMVLGDTWMDFMRVKQHNDFLHFVADPAGPSEPVTGSVHVNERPQESFLSLDDCVTMRKISKVEPGCFTMDLELLMLSLQFPELDEIPVMYSVKEVSAGEAAA